MKHNLMKNSGNNNLLILIGTIAMLYFLNDYLNSDIDNRLDNIEADCDKTIEDLQNQLEIMQAAYLELFFINYPQILSEEKDTIDIQYELENQKGIEL